MSHPRKISFVTALAALAAGCLLAVLLLRRWAAQDLPSPNPSAVPLAVLGNSDSHAYQDDLWFPLDGDLRGGKQRATTLQWTEALATLRRDSIDQGPWGRRGVTPRLARGLALVGVNLRTPPKTDFAFNMATSGARCEHLVSPLGQGRNLGNLLRRDPGAWERGAVLIRIGINDIGQREILDAVAAGRPGEAHALSDACVANISVTVAEIRAISPNTAIVLVGIADNSLWPPNLDLWRTGVESTRIQAFLDRYDDSLRQLAARTPRVAFLDDRAWFRTTFGGRDGDGVPQLRAQCVGGVELSYHQGDDLDAAILADGHAGTLLNLLWSVSVVEALRGLGLTGVPAVTPAEVEKLAASLAERSGVARGCLGEIGSAP